jgi:hypothetical protein
VYNTIIQINYAGNFLQQTTKMWKKNELVKGKEIPLQALTGPEGSRRLWLPDFKIIGT